MSDDASRRMRQDFAASYPRGPEVRATITGEGVGRWLWEQKEDWPNLKLVSATITPEDGTADFVLLRAPEESAIPTEVLHDLLAALQELPDAARLLVGSEITLSFQPGTPQ